MIPEETVNVIFSGVNLEYLVLTGELENYGITYEAQNYYILLNDNGKNSNFMLEHNEPYKCDIKHHKIYDENLNDSISYILDNITPVNKKEIELELSQNSHCNHQLDNYNIDNVLKNIMNYINMELEPVKKY